MVLFASSKMLIARAIGRATVMAHLAGLQAAWRGGG
jgi:hypothetical protein